MNFRSSVFELFLFLTVLMFANLAYATAGKVIFSSGINKAIDSNGEERSVRRGDTVDTGDLLQTSNGILQVRFADNGFVSVKPQSELLIQDYTYNGSEDGNESAIFSLLKGSIRAVTGIIGRKNKDAYQYRTPVATIGIRGTAFVLNYCNGDCFDSDGNPLSDGLYVNNGEGRVILTNSAGTIDLVRGQFAYVEKEDSAPLQTREAPEIAEQINSPLAEVEEVEEIQEVSEQNIQRTIVDTSQSRDRAGLTYSFNYFDKFTNGVNSQLNNASIEYNERLRAASQNYRIEGETVLGLEKNARGQQRLLSMVQLYKFQDLNSKGEGKYVGRFRASEKGSGQFASSNDIHWGTWESDWKYESTITQSDGSVTSVTADANSDNVFHYIFSNNLTPINDKGLYGSNSAPLNTTISYGSTSDTVNGGNVVFYQRDSKGNFTKPVYGKQSVFMQINFNNGNVDEFYGNGTFGDKRTYEFKGVGENSIYKANEINIAGACSELLCEAKLTGSGAATIDFVGENAEAAIGGFGIVFSDTQSNIDSIINGTYYVEANKPDAPAKQNQTGLLMAGSGLDLNNGVASVTGNSSRVASATEGAFSDINFANSGDDTSPLVSFSFKDTILSEVNFIAKDPVGGSEPTVQSSFNDAFGVSWGVWTGSYSYAQSGSNGNLSYTETGPLHYVYSDNITSTSQLNQLASLQETRNFNIVVGGAVTYTDNVNGALVTQEGKIIDGNMNVNFGSGLMTDFTLVTDIGGANDKITLNPSTKTTLDSGRAAIDLQACVVCGGGNMQGDMAFQFVGSTANGAIGTFGLDHETTQEVITGSFVLQ